MAARGRPRLTPEEARDIRAALDKTKLPAQYQYPYPSRPKRR